MNVRTSPILGMLLLSAAFAAAPALAQDDDDDLPGAAAVAGAESEVDDDDDEGVETEDIFGFTEGSDTGEAGEKEISGSLLTRVGKDVLFDPPRGEDDYLALRGALEFEYGITDDLKVSVSGAGAYFNYHNVFDPGSFEDGGFDGLSGELKYRVLERGASPIGLAFGAETEWSRFDEASGEEEDSVALELTGFADAEIIPDRLFAALNVSYEPEWSLEDAEDEGDDEDDAEAEEEESGEESGLEISAALSGQVFDDVFVGGEARFMLAAEGLGLDEVEGKAFYLGPTVYAALSEHAYFKAAWSIQVAGEAEDGEGDLDLENFERHQVLAQIGVEF